MGALLRLVEGYRREGLFLCSCLADLGKDINEHRGPCQEQTYLTKTNLRATNVFVAFYDNPVEPFDSLVDKTKREGSRWSW